MNYPYIITDKKIVDAYIACTDERKDFLAKCNAFCELYDAKPELTKWGHEVAFRGIVFNNKNDVDYTIWTKPHSDIKYSRIREAKPKKDDREKIQLAKAEYDERINNVLGTYVNETGHTYMTKKTAEFMALLGIEKNAWVNYTFTLTKDNTLLLNVDVELKKEFITEIFVSEFVKLRNEK